MTMKKFLALLLLLTMLSTCALADTALTDCAIANGNVTATTFVDVTAPYSGTLASFDLSVGDRIAAGDALQPRSLPFMRNPRYYSTSRGKRESLPGRGRVR